MLSFIVGTAGTGKTTELTARIQETVRAGREAILIVPEQASFESEKRLYRMLGAADNLRVQVLGFTRLCDRIFREYGGLAGTPVTEAGRLLLMSFALGELRDRLTVYRKIARGTALLQTLLQTCGEFKSSGVSPAELESFLAQCEPGPLRDKLCDLSLIYSGYQGLLESGYTDPEDSLIRACALLEQNDFFAGVDVYIDGFTTFMSAEFELLGHMIGQAERVTLAMTLGSVEDGQRGVGVFSPAMDAVARLRRMAERQGVAMEPPYVLERPLRYRNPALGHLSGQFLWPAPVAYNGTADDVLTISCGGDYEQAERIAREIGRLVRERGYRYRQIAVIAREIEPFLHPLSMAFERYRIPFFADRRRDVENTPLIFGLYAALDAIKNNFDAQSMLLLAKSPIMGFDPHRTAQLENYCYIWDVRGRLWQSEFHNNPRGMQEKLDEVDAEVLAVLNDLRARLIRPLLGLRSALREGKGAAFASGIFAFLEEIGAAEHLVAFAEALPKEEAAILLDENARIWDAVMDILDLFGDILGEAELPWRRMAELFRLAVSATDVGSPPQTLDQVLAGSADRIRPGEVRAVFILGANEGTFPPWPSHFGVFSDDERETLIRGGIGVAPPGVAQAALERFFAYYAATLPSEFLAVCWSRAALEGGAELSPSVMVDELNAILPERASAEDDPLGALAGEAPVAALLASVYHRDEPLTATLIDYLEQHGQQNILERMWRLSRRQEHALREPSHAHDLFGTELRLSPSRVERYHRCPFAFFMQDGMQLRALRRAEYSPMESGSIIHHVLQVMVQKYGGRALCELPEETLREEVTLLISEYLSERIADIEHMPKRMEYLFLKLCGTLTELLRRLGREFSQSFFEPVAFELAIRQGGDVEPLRLQTPDGITVAVEGIVDRVDVMEKSGERYVRVIDYKSGERSFRLDDVMAGLGLQMLLYLFTIQERGTGSLEGAIPAGVLYMPVSEKVVRAVRGTEREKILHEREKQLCMDGLLLDEPEVLAGMERELAGLFIPAKRSKDGRLDARAPLASRAQLGSISRKVKRLIGDMAGAISRGVIPAVPVDAGDYNTCEWCDYRAACGFERDDPVRSVARMDMAAIYKKLEREDLADAGENVDKAAEGRH